MLLFSKNLVINFDNVVKVVIEGENGHVGGIGDHYDIVAYLKEFDRVRLARYTTYSQASDVLKKILKEYASETKPLPVTYVTENGMQHITNLPNKKNVVYEIPENKEVEE